MPRDLMNVLFPQQHGEVLATWQILNFKLFFLHVFYHHYNISSINKCAKGVTHSNLGQLFNILWRAIWITANGKLHVIVYLKLNFLSLNFFERNPTKWKILFKSNDAQVSYWVHYLFVLDTNTKVCKGKDGIILIYLSKAFPIWDLKLYLEGTNMLKLEIYKVRDKTYWICYSWGQLES